MKHLRALCLAAATVLVSSVATAFFHTWEVEQVFSNADGSVQFVVMTTNTNGENFSSGVTFTSKDSGDNQKQITFSKNLPSGATAGKKLLIATQSFAALGLVTPDFLIPDQFIPTGKGSVGDPFSVLAWGGSELPTDGVNALFLKNFVKSVSVNRATNFAGQSASVSLPPPPPTVANYQGLWWAGPVEDGWGINFAHQGKTMFGTWFTYDTTGKGWWLTLITDDSKSAPPVFQADLYATTGPPFNAVPFVKTGPTPLPIGSATVTFTDASNGSFHYDVNLPTGKVSQTKAITRQPLGSTPIPTCTFGGPPTLAAATNHQDIWWAGTSANPGTEQGWGINFAQQGGVVFASWFTYDLDGTPLWLVATLSGGTGDLFRPSGPRFDAYDKNQFTANAPVGTMAVTFADGNNATFSYNVRLPGMTAPAVQSKAITRQLFSATGTTCQ